MKKIDSDKQDGLVADDDGAVKEKSESGQPAAMEDGGVNKPGKKAKRKFSWSKALFYTVLVYLVVSLAFSIVLVITGGIGESDKTRGQYTLNILQCLFGVVIIFLPVFLNKKFKIKLPVFVESVYFIFLFCAIYLGEIRGFYQLIPIWDSILHIFSGFMLGALGFFIVEVLNEIKVLDLNPFFVATFAFCFSISLGVLWEIYEFLVDFIFNTNMQRYAVWETGENFIGQTALFDTMKDLIIDACGALAVSVSGGLNLVARRKRREAGEVINLADIKN